MKKILAILLAGTMVFSFTACGKVSNIINDTVSKVSVLPTIDDYIEKNQKEFDEIKKQYDGVMDVNFYSFGDDTVVFECTFLQDIPIDDTAMETSLDQSTSTYLDLIEEIQGYTGIDSPKIHVKCLNADGTVAFEKIYDENSKVPDNDTGSAGLNYKNLEEFVNSATIQDSLAASKEQFDGVMDVAILAEDNKLIYQYKYLEQIPDESLDTIAETLSESFESSKSTFEYIADLIESTVGIEDASVVIRFLNADDKVFYEDEVA